MIASRRLRFSTALLAFLILAVLGACGGGGVRGESPFAQVTAWRIDDRDLVVDLRLRNVNDEPLQVLGLDLSVTVGDGVSLFRVSEAPDVEIAAGGFETLRLTPVASEAGATLLAQLAEGEIPSLAYTLRGTVQSANSGDLQIERAGHIYTVPGRPGEFR